ncbi:hypothetical protein B0J11DRAFT_578690 [Dendryphion nanum]|uniref:Uncharacterized protein n=1 Tax=Dendryphion nanum TaxID=256645 RepID=A0A9P9E0P9_9PLEO|nr:hypothetical protein B0J11DRAFT_578690 [Dendryphion nanum]
MDLNLTAAPNRLPAEQAQKVVLTGRKRRLHGGTRMFNIPKKLPKYKKAKKEMDDIIYANDLPTSELWNGTSSSPDGEYIASSPPISRHRVTGRRKFDTPISEIVDPVDFAAPIAPYAIFESKEEFIATAIHKDVKAIYETLTNPDLTEIQMELPQIETDIHVGEEELANTDSSKQKQSMPKKKTVIMQYNSEHLFHLYILAYADGKHNICDLVVDTWIREFHRVHDLRATRIWKTNKEPWIDPDLYPIPESDNGDVSLDPKVTTFESLRLRELYDNTASDCGARALWADAIALCGGKLEARLDGTEKYRMGMGGGLGMGAGPEGWHPELMWNVMRTCMRLVRAKRTLKIEERHPSAWCDRYHEHGKRGKRCYREIANNQANGIVDDENDGSQVSDEGGPVQSVFPESEQVDDGDVFGESLSRAFEVGEDEDFEMVSPGGDDVSHDVTGNGYERGSHRHVTFADS